MNATDSSKMGQLDKKVVEAEEDFADYYYGAKFGWK